MSKFHRTHIAIFDKLKRQGVRGVDVGRLTRATLSATDLIAAYEGGSRPVATAAAPLRQRSLRRVRLGPWDGSSA